MNGVRLLLRIQIGVILVFAVFKVSRDKLLALNLPQFAETFLYSFPNFCEGVIGVLTLTVLGLYANRNFNANRWIIYALAVLLAAGYVISQELKWHNIGGENIYDPMDVVFSIIGLLVGALVVFRVQPQVESRG